MSSENNKSKFPTAQTVLLIIAALVALLTWFVPAGQYDRLSYDKETQTFTITHLKETVTLDGDYSEFAIFGDYPDNEEYHNRVEFSIELVEDGEDGYTIFHSHKII